MRAPAILGTPINAASNKSALQYLSRNTCDRLCLIHRGELKNLSLAANLVALSVEASPRDVRDTPLVIISGEIGHKTSITYHSQHIAPSLDGTEVEKC